MSRDAAGDLRALRDCQADLPGSWEAFVSRFTPYLAEACRRALSRSGLPAGPQEMADQVQEAFAALLAGDRRALHAYRGEAGVAAYLAAVAVHRIARQTAPLPPLPPGEREAASPGPGEILEAREDLERLRAGLGRLPALDRLALALQGDGASLAEIGLALGLSEAAAAQRVSRARVHLRKNMGIPVRTGP